MKCISQFLLILLFCLAGEFLHAAIPVPIPASIYGLVLLLLALKAGFLKLDQVKNAGAFLTGLFPLLFIPGAAGIMEFFPILLSLWLPILIILIPVTILVFGVAGNVTQWFIGRKNCV